MFLQQINRSDPEKVFGVFSFASAMAKDDVACLDVTTNVDGKNVITPASAILDLVVGIVDAAVAASGVGLVQMYGYRATSRCFVTDTSRAAGVKMVPVNAVTYLSYVAAADGRDGFFVTMESIATASASATTSKKIFIRCL